MGKNRINWKALVSTVIFLWINSFLIKNHSLLDNTFIPIQDLNTNFLLEPNSRKAKI